MKAESTTSQGRVRKSTKSLPPVTQAESKRGRVPPPVHSRWKKGQSGNPAGRKPGHKTLSEAMRAFLERPIDKKATMTMAEAIVTTMLKLARKGSVNAATFVRDTAEGKPPQRIEMQGSLQTKERERQVRFLIHTVKQTQQQIGGEVSVEQVWQVIEARELELFQENVQDLRPAVFAALGVGDGAGGAGDAE
jgi:Family of unknown function (DUF5681)